MGAWGGMHDGLHTITELMLEFLAVYSIKAKLLYFVRYLPSNQKNSNSKKEKFYELYE